MRRLLIIAIVFACLAPLTVRAQSTPAATCDLTILTEEVGNFKASGDTTKDLAALLTLQGKINDTEVSCKGMRFEGTANKVLGPIDLSKGLFLLTMTSTGYGGAEGKILDGTCGNFSGSTQAFIMGALNGDNPNIRAQSLTSQGCKLTIEISLVTGPWTLTIEPLQ